MTAEEFTAFYPQFAGFTPAEVPAEYIRQANARFTAFVPEDAEEARRLYVAHKLTLYAGTALPDSGERMLCRLRITTLSSFISESASAAALPPMHSAAIRTTAIIFLMIPMCFSSCFCAVYASLQSAFTIPRRPAADQLFLL